jgi:hypothetical protein
MSSLAHRFVFATTSIAALLSASTAARAHEGAALHVGTEFEECYFDLHSELTVGELKEFAREGGQIMRFRQLSSADTLGKWKFDVSLGYALFFIDDHKGAWNNTMSHPTGDHYLGSKLGFPLLSLRLGVHDAVDVEVNGTLNWASNYGFVGAATKIRVLRQSEKMPVSVAVRPSVAALLGPSEMQGVNASIDVSVSRNFHGFSPFAGVTTSVTGIHEDSADTDIGSQSAAHELAFAGVEYRYKAISAAAQAEISNIAAVGFRLGGTF